MRIPLVIIVVIGAVAQGPNSAVAAEPDWQIIQRLFQLDRVVPETGPTDGPVPVSRDYLFESFANMDGSVFRNGLSFLLDKYPLPENPADRPAYLRDMDYKLRVLFEYYPLVARDRSDFDALIERLYDGREPDVLRVFLLRHLGPGLEPPSTFGGYMQGHAMKNQEAFDTRLRELVQAYQESAAVQVAAIEAILSRTEEDYARLLEHDGLARTRAPELATLHIRQFIANPEVTKLSQHTQLQLDQKNALTGRWAESLQALASSGQRDAAVRDKAKEALATILRDFPIPNRDALVSAQQ